MKRTTEDDLQTIQRMRPSMLANEARILCSYGDAGVHCKPTKIHFKRCV